MIVKTTKQILDVYGEDLSLNDESLVWVGLESLKKEIKEMILKARRPYLPDDYVNGYIQALLNIQYLCNSQEQKSVRDTAVEKPSVMNTDCSVSCEHNTGEDKNGFATNSMSSPVQNPKELIEDKQSSNIEDWIKKYPSYYAWILDNVFRYDKDYDKGQNPKKCNCKIPECSIEELYKNVCGRCGGVL